MNKHQANDIIELSHGGGGKRMDQLIEFISNRIGIVNQSGDLVGPLGGDDSAVVQLPESQGKLVLTTDSHTVDPVFFKGGNIGDLAVAGTVNDLTVMGARPLYLTLGMIIEEGFSFHELGQIADTIGELCKKTGVRIVAGDTKVMPKGMLSNIVINTAGIGILMRELPIHDAGAQVGDDIIVTGTIGDHGTSLIALREGLKFDTELSSDVTPLWPALKEVIMHPGVHAMKDLTRGGFASAINDITKSSHVRIQIREDEIPVKPEAQAIAEILGLEILEVSCEGKVVMSVDPESSEQVLSILRRHQETKDARIIGKVMDNHSHRVEVITSIGGTRILDKPFGEPIPRVC